MARKRCRVMKVKIQNNSNGEITEEEVTPIYRSHHVNDNKYYPTLKDVEFDETSEYLLIENPNSCYGFSVLWLKDKKNKIYMSMTDWDIMELARLCVLFCKDSAR